MKAACALLPPATKRAFLQSVIGMLEFQVHGHAFEARIYAESPSHDFLPGAGKVRRWRLPPAAVQFNHEGQVRVDSAVEEGDTVGSHYDPMIAKLITSGEDRQAALTALQTALAQVSRSRV